MRHNPKHAVTDERVVRTLIAENPWGTIVSQNQGDIVASHYPVLLDDSSHELTVLTHVGRPDEEIHRLGTSEVLLIIAGPHGYISPSWYTRRARPLLRRGTSASRTATACPRSWTPRRTCGF